MLRLKVDDFTRSLFTWNRLLEDLASHSHSENNVWSVEQLADRTCSNGISDQEKPRSIGVVHSKVNPFATLAARRVYSPLDYRCMAAPFGVLTNIPPEKYNSSKPQGESKDDGRNGRAKYEELVSTSRTTLVVDPMRLATSSLTQPGHIQNSTGQVVPHAPSLLACARCTQSRRGRALVFCTQAVSWTR